MTTLPHESHRHRAVAESFGAEARRYDRSRPGYPDELVHRILDGSPGRDVLDIGCGTGISSRRFQAAGCRVVGVDPDTRMIEHARRRGLDSEVAAFEDWDPGTRRFDAAVCAQAWHWIDPVAGARKAADVLRPGGLLAIFWNAGRAPAALTAVFAEIYGRLAPESLVARGWTRPAEEGFAALGRGTAAAIRATRRLAEPDEWRLEWERPYTRDEWLDQVPTQGDHGRLPAGTQRRLLAEIGAAIDTAGGGFTMRYTVLAVTARRAPG
jgi:SAM-dependent methyltransferase